MADLVAVLLVDDDPDDRLLTRALVHDIDRAAYVLTEVPSYAEALESMVRGRFDICLVDYRLGEHTGLDLITAARARGSTAPVIMLTGSGNWSVDQTAMRLGVADYLVKGQLTADVLERTIRYTLDRARTVQALRESEERFRLLVDGVRDHAIFLLTPEGRVASWNAGAERLTGFTEAEIVGEHVSRFHTELDRQHELPIGLLEAAQASGTAHDEAWRVRQDGSCFWAEVTVTALRDDLGQLRGYAKVIHDNTERRRAEEQRQALLREQAARAEAEAATRTVRAVEHAARAEAEMAAARASVVAEVSRVLVENFMDGRPMLGRVAQIAAAATDTACVIRLIADAGDDAAFVPLAVEHADLAVRAELQRVMSAPQLTADLPWLDLDPGFLSVHPMVDCLAVPMLARTSKIGVLALARFGSEAHRLSAGDRAFCTELAARVALAVENSRLYQEARTAIGLRDMFLTIAAHELKTPLTTMQGYSQLLSHQLEHGLAQDASLLRRSAQLIQDRTRHLVRLVEQILDVSRLDAARTQLSCADTDLVGLIKDLVADFEARAGAPEFRLQCHAERLQAVVDRIRVEQVMANLIDNAVRYSPEGGPIDISVEPDQDDVVVVTVRDRGLGIAEAHRGHIFDRFYQAHAVDYRSGMGLGLHISREIVTLHGGTISAAFPEAGGSQFTVRLPRHTQTPSRADDAANERSD